jgi:Putative auto-transporter adhesin, head GIN domain
MQTNRRNAVFERAAAILIATSLGALLVGVSHAEFRISFGNKSQVVGSGKMIDVPRSVAAFDRVEVKDGVRATLRKGGDAKVVVSADDNVEPLVETTVNGSTLTLRMKPNTSLRTRNPIAVTVTYTKLERLAARDGASVDIDAVSAPSFVLQVSDGASLKSAGIGADKLEVTVTDGASVTLASARGSEAQSFRVSDGASLTVESIAGGAAKAKVSDGAKLSARGIDLKSIDVGVSDGASANLSGVAQQQVFAVSDGASIQARELNGDAARGRVMDGASLKAGTLRTLELEVDESASVRYAGDPTLTLRSREKLNVKKY